LDDERNYNSKCFKQQLVTLALVNDTLVEHGALMHQKQFGLQFKHVDLVHTLGGPSIIIPITISNNVLNSTISWNKMTFEANPILITIFNLCGHKLISKPALIYAIISIPFHF